MKIEKLTENKIRVIVNSDDLTDNNIDFNSLMNRTMDTQNLFFEILEKAEEELDFHTDGYKLLIEAFSSVDGVLVFTITKYGHKNSQDTSLDTVKKRKVSVKRKNINFSNKQVMYSFNSLEEFCNFCNCINNAKEFQTKKFSKNISLFLYNNTYYLVIKNINIKYEFVNLFYSIASEFGKLLSPSKCFENKLTEYGKVIMKKDAIDIGIRYFI